MKNSPKNPGCAPANWRNLTLICALLLHVISVMAGPDFSVEPDGAGGVQARAGWKWSFDQGQNGKPIDVTSEDTTQGTPGAGGSTLEEDKPWPTWVKVVGGTVLGAGSVLLVDKYAIDDKGDWMWEDEDKKKAAAPQTVNVHNAPVYNFTIDGNGNQINFQTGEGANSNTNEKDDEEKDDEEEKPK